VILAKNYENILKFIKVMHSKPQTLFFPDTVYTQIREASQYLTGWLGVPNLFFLHAVIPSKRPINAFDSSVIASSPNTYQNNVTGSQCSFGSTLW